MQLWAGFECTRNRVGDVYFDQLGPDDRVARDQCLHALPDLGVNAFRYRIAWDDTDTPWEQFETDLTFLSRNNIAPIAGLLHHGSGPIHTDLLSPDFAHGLSEHARKVAANFPWIEYWTPVNEPLTTARFSALYGYWYPHSRSEQNFWLALLNQIDATRLAMREIRRENPAAKLVQTEDLGKTCSTATMADQAAFDNQRRWMTWDLLTGRVVSGHPFYDRLCRAGFADRLRAIADDPCPPDIIGVDHYLTSDRFLDHRITRYPAENRGGNAEQHYADIEAVRVLGVPYNGLVTALEEAWDRYNIPVALTECHNGCTREEQMRWLREAWDAAELLNATGKKIIAVTSWALMGARDWSSLATETRGHFETGAFDPRGGNARPTAVAQAMTALSHDRPLPVAALGQGWWSRDSRLQYAPVAIAKRIVRRPLADAQPPLLIAGATGTLGQALLHAAQARGLVAIATSRKSMTLDCETSVSAALERYAPWGVINATGWVRVDDAESAPDACTASNVAAALTLARACEERNIPHVHFSSDLVFDGQHVRPYHEDDRRAPLSVYGNSKAQAEDELLALSKAFVIRTAAFFSPHDIHNFAMNLITALRSDGRFAASADHHITPTFVPHLARFAIDMLIDGEAGLWHASNGEELSWHEFAQRLALACDLDPDKIDRACPDELGWVAERPPRSGLVSRHGQLLPSLDCAIAEFAQGI